MTIDYIKNYDRIKESRENFRKRKRMYKVLKLFFIACNFSIIVSLISLSFIDIHGEIKDYIAYIGLISVLILIFSYKKIVRQNIIFGFENYPYQNPNTTAFPRPYSYIHCHLKTNNAEEDFLIQNKFSSDSDAWDYLIKKVEIEFDQWLVDKSGKRVIGYLLKNEHPNNMTECYIEIIFEIKNTRGLKILSGHDV